MAKQLEKTLGKKESSTTTDDEHNRRNQELKKEMKEAGNIKIDASTLEGLMPSNIDEVLIDTFQCYILFLVLIRQMIIHFFFFKRWNRNTKMKITTTKVMPSKSDSVSKFINKKSPKWKETFNKPSSKLNFIQKISINRFEKEKVVS